ncbi:proline--tRNA ligase [Miltoncostaea marina]|uniref:proline--tRNA ligase n=1 Tax=Miltoncostaea marina TaxID=2843215 RepID=UPI001C3E2DF6|nr:proline--tRNA ligase [Miltoncostaea marina]
MAKAPILASRSEDFPQWYQDVIAKAELAENGAARGTMVIRPYAYGIWERMQADMDRRIKACGAENVYLPLFIPESYLRREAEHVEGFSPELAVVTVAGGKELEEPLVVRPTSETLFGELMAKWVQSYRDLPLLLNQWANVVRWELRPRTFLRTTEFLWQEGHTAHATREDAAAYARRILLDVYRGFMTDMLAVPVLVGAKTARERFAGATNTMTCEAMMGDGKALQMGTSHELGQNFARAFGMDYLDDSGTLQHCWTTSWGTTTRMIGGLIMCHGDDHGLRVPPRVAHVQAVVMVVRDDDAGAVSAEARRVAEELAAAGVRARVDDQTSTGFGRRVTDWELKGVPVRVEIGPRDLAEGAVTLARRDARTKETVPAAGLATAVPALLEEIQDTLLREATAFRDSRTADVGSIDEAIEAARTGFARIPWDRVGDDGEDRLAEHAITVRCLQTAEGTVPGDDPRDLRAIVARAY